MDVWINFTHATKWQAEGIFKCFFPVRLAPAAPTAEEAQAEKEKDAKDASQKNLPGSKRKASKHAIPLLSETQIAELAKRFADSIPEDELSVSFVRVYNGVSSTYFDILGCKSSRVLVEEQDPSS